MDEIRHTYAPSLGKVGVKITHSTQGVSVEIDIDRPRVENENWEDTSARAVGLAIATYRVAVEDLNAIGVTVGKAKA